MTFNLTDKISWAVEVANESLVFDFQTIRRRKPVELTIKGEIIGVNDLEIYGHAASRKGHFLHIFGNVVRLIFTGNIFELVCSHLL